MANNHGADYGAAGLQDSLRAAEDSEVAVIGIGADPTEAYRPFRTSVKGVAVFAADASRLESNDAIWDVRAGAGPGMAADRNSDRLVAAVRQAAEADDVVAVYLHWGDEGVGCLTADQRTLAAELVAAGADVVVGAHAHLPLGAGMLGDTYVSYGLGNFLWYNNIRPDTGVLRLQIVDGLVVGEEWVPGAIPDGGEQPVALTGAARTAAVDDWTDLRGCTDLDPGPGAAVTAEPTEPDEPTTQPTEPDEPTTQPTEAAELPAYASSIVAIPAAIRAEMTGSSHLPESCPDNSSGYNCRPVAGSDRFSDHAYSAAIDINPVENPYVTDDGVLPAAGRRFVDVDRSPGAEAAPGVIVTDDVVHRAFTEIGWEWGGDYTSPDYQHFSAP